MAIYDDATPRSNSVPGFGQGPGPIDSLLWKADGTAIYGADTEGTSSDLFVLPVDASGVYAGNDYIEQGTFGFVPRDYNATTGYVYASTGQAVDPANGAVVGTFPFNAVQGGASGYDGVVTDGKLNIAFFLVQTLWDTTYQEDVLEAFDLTHFTFLGAIAVPGTGAQSGEDRAVGNKRSGDADKEQRHSDQWRIRHVSGSAAVTVTPRRGRRRMVAKPANDPPNFPNRRKIYP